MKETFGFDMDGVLYPWHEVTYEHISRAHKIPPYEEFWQSVIDGTDGFSELFWNNVVRIPTLYSNVSARAEDVETVNKLAEDYNIVYLSHRPKEVEFVTMQWLKRYNFPCIDNVYLTSLSKDVAVRLYECDYYIEDRGEILASNLRNVTTLIAKRTLWNWDECETLPYVDTIPELIPVLQELK